MSNSPSKGTAPHGAPAIQSRSGWLSWSLAAPTGTSSWRILKMRNFTA
jgi:hypothetical protein